MDGGGPDDGQQTVSQTDGATVITGSEVDADIMFKLP